MKRNLLLSFSSLLFSLMLLYSCQKETLTNENDLNGSAFLKSKDDSKDKCRLVYSDYADGLYTETYSYNSKGLVKEVKLGSLGSFIFMQLCNMIEKTES